MVGGLSKVCLGVGDTFWTKDVQDLWKEVSEEMEKKGKEEGYGADCETLQNPSDKTACKYLHAGLEALYKAPDASAPQAPPAGGAADLLKNNPSFRQTMGCFLLHAYAKHMKEKATCLIDQGIQKAFALGENLSKSGTNCSSGKCIPCQWQKEDSKWECCLESITIDSTNGEMKSAKDKVNAVLKDDKTNMDAMAKQINTVTDLCDQFKCVANRWLKEKKARSTDLDRVRSTVTSQITDLSKALKDATSEKNRKNYEQYCSNIMGQNGKAADKDACILIAAGLQNLYKNAEDDVDKSLGRAMKCVLLNAVADKMEKELPCKEERSVVNGINKAFENSEAIKNRSGGCHNNDKCFKCERFTNYEGCKIKTNDNGELQLKNEIDLRLKEDNLANNSSLLKSSLIKTIYAVINGSAWLSGSLLNDMKSKSEQGEVDTYCTVDKDGAHWEEGAAGEANRTACKMIAAGLKNISSIQLNYKNVPGANDNNENPFDHQEFRQLASCLLLKEVAKKMIKQSPICDISKGIERAFQSAGTMKTQHCIKEPCFVCNWEDKEKYGHCKKDNGPTEMKTHLETWLQKKSKELKDALSKITDIDGNKGTLCRRLQCLSSKVEALKGQQGQPQYNAENFWKKDDGEVATLWKELADAMKKSNGAGNSDCNQMDDGTPNGQRDATNPEKKACNYLHAGLKKLYEDTASTGSTPSVANDKILDKNPLLRQTVGCLLLNAYAKKMKGEAKCLVESGIKKAFGTYSRGLITNGSCNVTEPCVPCHWQENILESCEINVNGKKENAKDKLTQVQDKITETSTETLTKINEMKNLCDYIKCAAPNWFKSKLPTTANGVGVSSTTPTTTWCDFWGDKGVKTTLTKMFTEIRTNGTRNNIAVCTIFGDGNPQSVERKACNHIAAGLQHIKGITGSSNGVAKSNDQDKQLLDGAVACIALNLYADQIREKSKDKCPIDETRIEKMFNVWNKINKYWYPCNGANNNLCFECTRHKDDFKNCELSVSKTLINTASNGTCPSKDNTNREKVHDEMNKFLNESNNESISEVKKTLSTINDMSKSFCTQLQCAARKWNFTKKNKGTPPSWNDIEGVVKEELPKLLEHMSQDGNQTAFNEYCKEDIGTSWSTDTDGEKTAKRKACKLFASGLKHISSITDDQQKGDGPLKRTTMCAALNLYADQLIDKANNQCPLDSEKLKEAIKYAFDNNNSNATKDKASSCGTDPNSCFECKWHEKHTFADCRIGTDKIEKNMSDLLDEEDKSNSNSNTTPTMDKTLEKINKIETFCTQVQCAIKQHYRNTPNGKKLKNGTEPSWSDIDSDAKDELKELLEYMIKPDNQSAAAQYCKDNENKWNAMGHKEGKTNKAACLLFASGLKHIYTHGIVQKNGQVKDHVKGPSFEQTMGCLFLKEYAKQLKEMAKKQKKYRVHPNCSVDSGIDHAFEKSKVIMQASPQCKKNVNNDCFECDLNKGYDKCSIGDDDVGNKAKDLFEGESEQNHMQQTLENTVCPILLTDILTPFLPLAPVSIGLSAMAYYLWKYFGPLGKGGARLRRSPAEIPGPSVQEQVYDHVQQDSSHEYQLVKERKPRSVPTRTKRSGRVNRRTIIEIHFEVLDECQKGDTQLNQKDFLELLVQEFMGSEFMEEEEQVPKEELFMEGVSMESVPIKEVPSLGSGLMV
ncbi:SICAvar type I [Plasmodium knowlesi]|uniref:SICAvar type I n=1 Tax=Plasmodium knowlesi TaxID=5850 RepID=A0A1Y3DPF4_PLAKN|nr:SICAvar type I [Plasmodium knowlesi]